MSDDLFTPERIALIGAVLTIVVGNVGLAYLGYGFPETSIFTLPAAFIVLFILNYYLTGDWIPGQEEL